MLGVVRNYWGFAFDVFVDFVRNYRGRMPRRLTAGLLGFAGRVGAEATRRRARILLGQMALEDGNRDAARTHFVESVSADRTEATREAVGLTWMAESLVSQGDLEAAEETLREALSRIPDDGWAQERLSVVGSDSAGLYCMLGRLARRRDDEDAAETHFEDALAAAWKYDVAGSERQALKELAWTAFVREDADTAERHAESAVEIANDEDNGMWAVEPLGVLELVAAERGDGDAADEYRERAVRQATDTLEGYRETLGEVTLDETGMPGSFATVVDVCEQTEHEQRAATWCEDAVDVAERYDHADIGERFSDRLAGLETASD